MIQMEDFRGNKMMRFIERWMKLEEVLMVGYIHHKIKMHCLVMDM